MKYDIRDTIAKFVRAADPGFDEGMERRDQNLRRTSCINLFYGRWVDGGVEFLFSVFELEDQDFATRLPAMAHLTKAARRQFLEHMKDHLEACSHCALKHECELDLNARIERAFQQNSGSLLQQLRTGALD